MSEPPKQYIDPKAITGGLSGVGHVVRNVAVTPRMRRITVTSEALRALERNIGPDRAIRLFFPLPDKKNSPSSVLVLIKLEEFHDPSIGSLAPRPYTIRNFDADRLEMDIDFFLYQGSGVALRFATEATQGDKLGFWIPSGLLLYKAPPDVDCHVLAGDETALPGILGTLEHLSAGVRALAFCEVVDKGEEHKFETKGDVKMTWLHRGNTPAGESGLIVNALRNTEWPGGKVFAYVCAEAKESKVIRQYLREERKLAKEYCRVVAYWKRGRNLDDLILSSQIRPPGTESAERTQSDVLDLGFEAIPE